MCLRGIFGTGQAELNLTAQGQAAGRLAFLGISGGLGQGLTEVWFMRVASLRAQLYPGNPRRLIR